MSAVLAFFSAILYGVADFSGGYATRKNSVFSVMLLSQAAGAIVALVASPLLGVSHPTLADLLWGLAAGVGGSLGLALLYRGLSLYTAAIVSPLSAVVGAVVPAAFGAIMGERPSSLALVGVVICLPAILLLSYEKGVTGDRAKLRSSFLYGSISGIGFGFFFVAISRTSSLSGLWPLVAARAASLSVAASIIVFGRKGFSVAKPDRPTALLAGVADMGANICFLVASRSELLMLVTLITSLYPAPTVVLARIFQGQRISLPRAAGIALAIAGVALMGQR
jgi:drug/metabolite transporter (DMT)-like permease